VSGVQEARIRAVQLRIAGASFQQIAQQLEVSQASAFRYVADYIEEQRRDAPENVQQIMSIEVMRLDALIVGLWPHRQDLDVLDRLLNVMALRQKLLGLHVDRSSVDLNVNGTTNTGISLGSLDLSKLDNKDLADLERILEKAGPRLDDPSVVSTVNATPARTPMERKTMHGIE
jgi:transposase-like protein